MTGRAGIIGFPVAHSLSPVFQGAAFAAAGLDITYELWETPPGSLPARVASLRAPGTIGANVTIPHKEAAAALVDSLDDAARTAGAVNTIVTHHGRLSGHNTDGPGFVRALRDEASVEVGGSRFLLVGAGGAARGIAFALAAAGAARITIANRTAPRAERLAAEVRATGYGQVGTADLAAGLSGFSVIVNATSIGMAGGPDPDGLPVTLETATEGALVVDIVYRPEETPLLREARARGLPVLGGLPMLIYQGALAFELWTGQPAPVGVMFESARASLEDGRTLPR